MCTEMTRLACRGAPFKQGYLAFMEGAKYTSDLVEVAISQAVMKRAALDGSSKVATHVPGGPHLTELLILDPNVSQSKGRKKEVKGKDKVQWSGRMKSGLEVATTRNKRLCGSCHKYRRHDKRNRSKNPNNRNKGAMEIDSSSDGMTDALTQLCDHLYVTYNRFIIHVNYLIFQTTTTWINEWTTRGVDV
ncbi:hypothetical protein Dimus_017800 [Dionaea muscipula]